MSKNHYESDYNRQIIYEISGSYSDSQEVWNGRFKGKNISFLGTDISQTEDEIIIHRIIVNRLEYLVSPDSTDIENLEFVLTKTQEASVYIFLTNKTIIVDGIIIASEKIMNSNSNPILRIYLENSAVQPGPDGISLSL
jgi:hypothetical protein